MLAASDVGSDATKAAIVVPVVIGRSACGCGSERSIGADESGVQCMIGEIDRMPNNYDRGRSKSLLTVRDEGGVRSERTVMSGMIRNE